MKFKQNAVIAALVATSSIALAACGGDSAGSTGGETVKVGISDAGCSPAVLKLTPGPKNFEITATGNSKVTEYEIFDGKRIIGERENITPGIVSKFSLDLKPGEYVSYCPHGTTTERGKVIVSGSAPTAK
jgi:iron uptake system component EfeO